MLLTQSLVLAFLSALPTVLGHGYVQEVTLGSTKYPGFLINSDPYTKFAFTHSIYTP